MSLEIAWKNILVTDANLLKSLLVVFGFGSQAFICESADKTQWVQFLFLKEILILIKLNFIIQLNAFKEYKKIVLIEMLGSLQNLVSSFFVFCDLGCLIFFTMVSVCKAREA